MKSEQSHDRNEWVRLMTFSEKENHFRLVRYSAGIAILLMIVSVLYFNRKTDLVDIVIRNERQLQNWVSQSPFAASIIAALSYAVITSLPIPLASVGSIFVGWLFGFWLGLPIVSIGSTLGASITFLVSRYCFYEFTRSIKSQHLESFQKGFVRDGTFYIASLRLMPGLPFFLVNVFLSQTRVAFLVFWTISMLSMLPASAIYVVAGSTLPSLTDIHDDGMRSVMTWPIVIAFVVLAVQPLLFRWIIRRYRKAEKANV